MNIEEKKKRKSCSPCLDNFEKPLGGRGRVFLSLASASSREPGTYQVGTQYLLAETKGKRLPECCAFASFSTPWLCWVCAASAGGLQLWEQGLLRGCGVLTGCSRRWLLPSPSTGSGPRLRGCDGQACLFPSTRILLDQGSNPQHWQVDSYLHTCHQGTLVHLFKCRHSSESSASTPSSPPGLPSALSSQ